MLRIASPMFPFGILVVVGHVIGLVVPECGPAVGMSEYTYHVQAIVVGAIAGITTLAGNALMIFRRPPPARGSWQPHSR